jgi:hypothetical protein
MSNSVIRPETPTSLFVLGAVMMAIFGLYNTFEPSITQINVNTAEIRSNQKELNELKITQKAIFKHMIDNKAALSRIEGRLDAARITQGR